MAQADCHELGTLDIAGPYNSTHLPSLVLYGFSRVVQQFRSSDVSDLVRKQFRSSDVSDLVRIYFNYALWSS